MVVVTLLYINENSVVFIYTTWIVSKEIIQKVSLILIITLKS